MQIPSDQSQARQVSSECCHSLGDWWVRSVHSEEAGREGSTPKSVHSSDADVFEEAEGNIQQQPLLRGGAGIGGVFSPGHVSKEVGREPKRAPHSLPHQEERLRIWVGRYVQPRVDRRKHGRMVEQSYNPIVPVKVGNRRASEKSGHGTHWREGGSKRTNLLKGDIVETQNSNRYVHRHRQNS